MKRISLPIAIQTRTEVIDFPLFYSESDRFPQLSTGLCYNAEFMGNCLNWIADFSSFRIRVPGHSRQLSWRFVQCLFPCKFLH